MKKTVVSSVLFFTVGSLMVGCAQQGQVVVPQITQQVTVERPENSSLNDVSYVTPQYIDADTVLSAEKIQKLVATYNANLGYKPDKPITWTTAVGAMSAADTLKDFYNFYNVGKFNQAPYQGWNLLVLSINCDGPCANNTIYRYAQNPVNGDLVLLTKHSDPDAGNDVYAVAINSVATVDKKTTLATLDMPATLAIPGTEDVVKLKMVDTDFIPESMRLAKLNDTNYNENLYKTKLFDSEIGPVYADGSNQNDYGIGCVHVKKPDGSVATYSYDFGYDNLKITMKLKDNTVTGLNSNYVSADRGCGIGNSCYYTRVVNESNLEEYATLSNGLKLYKPIKTIENADPAKYQTQADIAMVAMMYKSYSSAYQYGDKSKPKVTFAQYLATAPVLFWKDPFNRWSALVSVEFQPAAECGKPVVYLYPQKDTQVNVKVGIDQITKTIPDYGVDGWSVLAHPDGKITNLVDGLNYPYLFWEGQSQKVVETESGFVVARGDLSGFLNKTLAKAGLNQKESKDFVEFWYPRMMANQQPYFIVKFLGTKDFNKIAPLNISPKPDTLARIFMYYQPSDFKVNLRPQIINGFKRNGFTVVEWGGTSNTVWLQ